MTKTAQQQSGAQRRAATRQLAGQQRRQRRMTQIAGLALVVILLVSGGWWFLGRSEADAPGSSGQALYQFDTQDFHSLAFDPDDSDTIFFGHHQGLKVSRDAGESWQDTQLRGVDAMQLAMPAADTSRRYAAGHNVFYVSTDGGQSWQSQPNNLPGLDLHTFTGSASDPLRLYAIPVGQGPFTSADGGVNWQPITMPPGGDNAPVVLAVDPADALHVFAGIGSAIVESRDGGQSWQDVPGARPEGMILSIAVAPSAQQTMYAGTASGLFRRGADDVWESLPVQADGVVLAVAVSPTQPDRVAIVDQQGNFYRSDDGGQTWAGV